MDEIGSDGLLRHDVPAPLGMRILLVAGGIFVVSLATWELVGGVWPLNITSPFFALLIAGAFSVGVPMAMAGLFAPSTDWVVSPGSIAITLRTPFRTQQLRFEPDDVETFTITEHANDDGPNSYSVLMTTKSGRKHGTRIFGTRETAERFRERVEGLFRS